MSFPEKINLLLVDDQPQNLLSLEALLDHPEYNLVKAGSGREALKAVLKQDFALILLDVQMPDMDGFETARLIKARDKTRDIPIIFITAISKENKYVFEGYETGAIDYIFKPFDPYILKGKVTVIIDLYKNKKRLECLNKELQKKDERLNETIRKLDTLNLELEQRVQERTEEIIAARDKLERQTRLLYLLNHIVRQIGEKQDLPSIFKTVLAMIEDQFPVDWAGIFNIDSKARTLTLNVRGPKSTLAASGANLPGDLVLPLGDWLTVKMFQDKFFYLATLAGIPHPIIERARQMGIHSVVAVLLSLEGKNNGILVAGRKEKEGFSSKECEFFNMLGEHLSLAIHHIHLYESLEKAYEEIKVSQRAILQQERLKALGQMASGIAHDINNALSPVVGYADLLLEHEKELSERGRRYVETIRMASGDIGKTIARMREFYRKRDDLEITQPIEIKPLVEQVRDLSRPRWFDLPQKEGRHIEFIAEISPDLPALMGIENELREALTNLIFNAVDAMPQGGKITLRAYGKNAEFRMQNAEFSRQRAGGSQQSKIRNPKSAIVIEVADSGIGMDEETRRRALEPFFTTKGEGGTGLGLAMVFGTMERHNGQLEIESVPGEGTAVRVIFPVKECQEELSLKTGKRRGRIPMLNILSIDDEHLIRELVSEMLTKDGHMVLTAEGGEAGVKAFEAAKEAGRPFDVVITDLGMPYVDGREVTRRIKESSSETPVILLTGWGGRLKAEGDIPAQVDLVLGKPPKLWELREGLNKVMSSETLEKSKI